MGLPEYNSRALFEKLMLEGFQAGLSWITILNKRDNLRKAFAEFDPDILCMWGEVDVNHLLQNPGIIRHRGKIEATLSNAKAWQSIENDIGFGNFLWRYVDGKPILNAWENLSQVPSQTPLSRQISKDLKKAGFKFCGPTTVYAFLQAAGLVDDHLITCPFRHP